MADQSDIEEALVAFIAGAIYPDGTDAPSVPGPECRIYRGWPHSAALDADLRQGVVNVTVFAGPGEGRATTRYNEEWTAVPVSPTLTALVSGESVIFQGTANAGQIAGVLVDERTYVYRVQSGDTAAMVAANIAVLLRMDRIVQLTGSTLSVPGAGKLVVRIVADAQARKEVRRQSQVFKVSCWCPTPETRDATVAAIDQSFADLRFLNLPDGSQGRLTYSGTTAFDRSQDALLYRRDLLYDVEYPTILTALQPAMLFGEMQLNATTFTA
jgi:hypothetical protein